MDRLYDNEKLVTDHEDSDKDVCFERLFKMLNYVKMLRHEIGVLTSERDEYKYMSNVMNFKEKNDFSKKENKDLKQTLYQTRIDLEESKSNHLKACKTRDFYKKELIKLTGFAYFKEEISPKKP